jgi:ABC-type sugar transport system substrate-binding protein
VTAPSRKFRFAALAPLAIVPVVALSACTGSSSSSTTPAASGAATSAGSGNAAPAGLKDGLGSRAQNRNAYFITYYNPAADAFWNQMLTGAQDAATLGGLKLTHQTTDGTDPSKMTDLINAAIATKPAALFLPFTTRPGRALPARRARPASRCSRSTCRRPRRPRTASSPSSGRTSSTSAPWWRSGC